MAGTTEFTKATLPRPAVRANQASIVLVVAIYWLTQQPLVLLIPVSAGIGGLFFQYNFIVKFALRLLKHPWHFYTPEDKDDLRFNQAIATTLLVLAFVSDLIGWQTAAYVLSGVVFIAATVAILGFCIGCFIRYRYLVWRRNLT